MVNGITDVLERFFPGRFAIDPRWTTCQTYIAYAEGSYVYGYDVFIHDKCTGICIAAHAPVRITIETVGEKKLASVNDYIHEANQDGLYTLMLTQDGILRAQSQLQDDLNDIEDIVYKIINYLDCQCLPIIQVLGDDTSDPRRLAFQAHLDFTTTCGRSIAESLRSAAHNIKKTLFY